jgi:hypothetical protein
MRPRRRKATPNPAETRGERRWKPPERSDQPDGEQVVQVNDAYTGGKDPEDVHPLREQQHRTGG